jgi:hypothetical protein
MASSEQQIGWLNASEIPITEEDERDIYGASFKDLQDRDEAILEELMMWGGFKTVNEAKDFLKMVATDPES